jgi:hypothetical protein
MEHVYYSALQMDESRHRFEQRWQFCCLPFHQQEKFTCTKRNLSRRWYTLAKGTFAADRQQLQNTSLTRRQVQGSKHPLLQRPNEKRMQHATFGLFNFLTLITVFTLFDSSKLSTSKSLWDTFSFWQETSPLSYQLHKQGRNRTGTAYFNSL